MTKITRVEIILLKVPYLRPFQIALARMENAENIVVRIHDSDGLIGVGEGCPPRFVTGEAPETAFEAAQLYARLLVGKDPLEIGSRLEELERFMLKNSAIRCAYDLALYDLLAKHARLPLYALLGGTKKILYSNRTIGLDSPEGMAQTARAYVAAGARSLKIKVGSGREEDIARVRAIRQAAGDGVQLRLDANQAWNETAAHTILSAVEDCDVQVCEQPLLYWNLEGLVRLRERSSIAIMADEAIFDSHDAFRLAASGAVDFINIKLAKSAGIQTALKINAVAEAAGVQCMLGGMSETMIGVSAGAHLICACPNITLADLDSPFHFAQEPTCGGVDFCSDGTVTLADVPGHGADLKLEWMAASQMATIEE